MEFLSIGIPAHNEAESIETTLRHLVQQTAWKKSKPREREIIVCVNGSTDETERIVRSFASRSGLTDQIKVIVTAKGDYFHAMKLIAERVNSSAPYAFFVDADVIPHHKMVERLELELQKPNVKAAASQLIPIERFAHVRSPLVQSQVERFALLKKAHANNLHGGGFGLKRSHFHLFNVPDKVLVGDLYLTEKIGRSAIGAATGAKSYFRLPRTAGDYLRQKVRNMFGESQVFGSANRQPQRFTLRNLLRNIREEGRQKRSLKGRIGAAEEMLLRTIAMKIVNRHLRKGTLPTWKKVRSTKLIQRSRL